MKNLVMVERELGPGESTRGEKRQFPANWAWLLLVLNGFIPGNSHAGEGLKRVAVMDSPTSERVEFEAGFLPGRAVDLSRYAYGNPIDPGVHRLDVFVNGERRQSMDVQFVAVPGSSNATPCFAAQTMESLGVDVGRLPGQPPSARPDISNGSMECKPLRDWVPEANAVYDVGELKLDLVIPQFYLINLGRGYVDPARWDSGINAGVFQYSLNSYTSEPRSGGGGRRDSVFLNLNSGLNLGDWRFRHRSTKQWANNGAGSKWASLETYARRDIVPWRSTLTVGDGFAGGDIFDSVNLRGIQLGTDDSMLPDALRSYAPIVRGVAETNARVEIRQNGTLIAEQSVPPGPFEIRDFGTASYSGADLQVTVIEANGREQRFSVPFSSMPLLLPEGGQRYSLAAGKYRDLVESGEKPWVMQATYRRGLSNLLTGYTGMQASEGYAAGLLGVAWNTPVGALGLDLTTARTVLRRSGAHRGVSTQLSYSSFLEPTGTSFSFSAYRYSTKDFYGLRDAVYARASELRDDKSPYSDYRLRNRFRLTINQRVGDRGSLYVTGSRQNYWAAQSADLNYTVGYSSSYRGVAYSLYAQRMRSGQDSRMGTLVSLTFSIPLGRETAGRTALFDSLTTSMTRDVNGGQLIQTSIYGSGAGYAGSGSPYSNLSYGITATHSRNDDERSDNLSANGTYRSSVGTYDASLSAGSYGRQASFGISGALIAHGGGVTLAPPIGSAAALVEAKGAAGGRLLNGSGAEIDASGYGVVPFLMPYRLNTVTLDPAGIADDVSLDNTSEEVVPRRDAIVRVRMATTIGRPVLARLQDQQGATLPMGSEVFDQGGALVGTVGQAGVVLLRGVEGIGKLRAVWGAGSDKQCVLPYDLPSRDPKIQQPGLSMTRVLLQCETS